MYLLIGLCENPGFLRALYFVLLCMDAVFAIVPVVLIVMLLIDFSKSMIAGADDSARKNNKLVLNRIITALILFAIPWLINVFVNLMDQMGFSNGFTTCINSARNGNFDLYDKMYDDYKKSIDDVRRADLAASRVINEDDKAYSDGNVGSTGTTNMVGSAAINNYTSGIGMTIDGEPDNPLKPLINLYNGTKNSAYNPDNFVAMKDIESGYSLGAWPSDANVSNLSGTVSTYENGILIYPTTGNGYASYKHNGIDIVTSKMGTPIYAPADGTLIYSEWGHTANKGTSETAYSATITLDKPFSYSGEWSSSYGNYATRNDTVSILFLTHMSGIKYRIGSKSGTSSIHVKQGDLIGFSGIANGCIHLHITFYNNDYSYGLSTDSIRKIYKLETSSSKKAGE